MGSDQDRYGALWEVQRQFDQENLRKKKKKDKKKNHEDNAEQQKQAKSRQGEEADQQQHPKQNWGDENERQRRADSFAKKRRQAYVEKDGVYLLFGIRRPGYLPKYYALGMGWWPMPLHAWVPETIGKQDGAGKRRDVETQERMTSDYWAEAEVEAELDFLLCTTQTGHL